MDKAFISFTRSSGLETYPIKVEVADTPEEQKQGLMDRSPLPAGMLFVFPSEMCRTFHMRNVLHPLDMIFFNSNLDVVAIEAHIQPDQDDLVCPTTPAQYVLEVPAGKAAELGLQVGDSILQVDSADEVV